MGADGVMRHLNPVWLQEGRIRQRNHPTNEQCDDYAFQSQVGRVKVYSHELFRVRAAAENGESAVKLFGEHDASEFVRIGHRAERELQLNTLAK